MWMGWEERKEIYSDKITLNDCYIEQLEIT